MSLGFNVVYDYAGSFPPGYAITVSGLDTVTGADTVLVQHQNILTGEFYDVRGLSKTPVLASTANGTDFEFNYYYDDPLGFNYICTVYKADGTVAATATSSTFMGSPARTDLQAAFPQTSVEIISVTSPSLSTACIITSFDTWTIPGRVLGSYNVLGRANPVVITDAMGGMTGTFTVLLDEAITNIPDDNFLSLITYNDTFRFQQYYHTSGLDSFYFKVTDVTVQRLSIADLTPTTSRMVPTILQYEVSFAQVDRPIADSAAVTVISWQDVYDNNATWLDVKNGHATWLDVLNNPTG